jgi:hypothetical protein
LWCIDPDVPSAVAALTDSDDSADGAVGFSDDFESPHAAVTIATAATYAHVNRICMTSPWPAFVRPGRDVQAMFRALLPDFRANTEIVSPTEVGERKKF